MPIVTDNFVAVQKLTIYQRREIDKLALLVGVKIAVPASLSSSLLPSFHPSSLPLLQYAINVKRGDVNEFIII